ncbi:hypothetical protein [Stieleria tagensis]|nr:hypothetical protein [Stieleria tagensis]
MPHAKAQPIKWFTSRRALAGGSMAQPNFFAHSLGSGALVFGK